MDTNKLSEQTFPDTNELLKLAELYKAMGDQTRMTILWILMSDSYCVSELSSKVKLSESAISHQLRYLKAAKLVRPKKIGKNVFYALADEHISWILRSTYEHITEAN